MATPLISALVPPLISGIFTIVVAILQGKLKNVPTPQITTSPTPQITTSPTTGVSHFVCLGKVLLHAGIVLLVITTAFFVVVVTTTYLGMPLTGLGRTAYLSHFFLFRWIPYVLSFMWVAAKVDRVIRWKHLTYVAIIVYIIQIPIHYIYYAMTYILVEGGSPASLTFSFEIFFISYTLVQAFVGMGAGGAITNAMKPY